jgi:gliding motility-associated-like protein
MRYHRLFTFIILFLCAFGAKAAVFTVTSNADTGPGTLREALTLAAANGSAEKDYIYFNLSDVSEAGRTITLNADLPGLSANLKIDGLTQPGLTLGVSGAKVKVINSYAKQNEPLRIFQGNNIGDFDLNGIVLTGGIFSSNTSIIDITDSQNISISNCVVETGNLSITRCAQATLKSNFCGFLPDGVTGYINSFLLTDVLNSIVGGTPAEGNLVSGGIIVLNRTLLSEWTFSISNNKLGSDYTGTSSNPNLFTVGDRITVNSDHYELDRANLKKMHGEISDNQVVNFGPTGIFVSGPGDVAIKRNAIGTDKTGTIDFYKFGPDWVQNSFTYAPTAIVLEIGIRALVGGDNGDGNIIGYTANGVLEQLADQLTISQNSIFCLRNNYYNIHDFIAYPKNLPFVKINPYTNNSISGIATAGARVELFSNEDGGCLNCGAKHFLTSVDADAQGNWAYNGILPANIVASAIYNNQTSLFTKAEIDLSGLTISQPPCGESIGKISGIKYFNASTVRWTDENDATVGTSIDITNLPPGRYKLKIGTAPCGAESDWISILDNSVKINATAVAFKHPSCTILGSITGITASTGAQNQLEYAWAEKTKGGVAKGTTADITDLSQGEYTLTVTDNITHCQSSYGPIILTNAAAPVIVENSYTTSPSNCNSPTGAINGIYATGGTGTLKYSWRNAQDQEVSTSPNPTNQYAGKYRLRVTDDSNCGPVYSTEIEILESNGVSLDLSGQGGVSPSCNRTNGSITGLQAPGATSFEWVITGTTTNVGHSLNLIDVPAGFYTLTISNATCSRSYDFEVAGFPPTAFTGITSTKTKSCDAFPTGTISLNTDNANEQPSKYLWLDEQGTPVGYTKEVQFLKAGKYRLQLTDKNFCPSFYPEEFTIEAYPKLEIKSYGKVTDATCGVGTGSITATEFKGGSSNYTYQWLDENGTALPGETKNFISNLAPGKYTLHLTDGTCIPGDVTYTVKDVVATPPTPSADNVRVYNAGKATIKINNPFPTAIYRIYETASSPQPIKDTIGGNININVTESRSYYVSLTYGYCESARTEVKVFLSALTGDIVNTFTPNSDGVNDYWVIKGLDTYPDAMVSVFNRYGQPVFQSTGYAKPFDGNRNGKPLPVGVYYYIINLKRGDVLSGNVTILR